MSKKREKGVCMYHGDIEETNKFQFRVLYEGIVYNAVYKDEYMQVIEKVRNPLDAISDEHIEAVCELVEKWFVENENNAWWLENKKI